MKTIPILTSVSLDGTVTINIAYFGYTYRIDAGFIPKIQKLFRHNPWAAVNTLKRKAYHVTKQKGDGYEEKY
jgi:hypothetical protein